MFECFGGFDSRAFGVSIRENAVKKKYNSVERELFPGDTMHGPFENLLTNFAQARILATNRDTVVPNSIDGRNTLSPLFFLLFFFATRLVR